MLHKDQERVRGELCFSILELALKPEGVEDCTTLVRTFLQGPDPLLLMRLCPEEFGMLCALLRLTVGEGKEAIETAHWRGPATLLEGSGLTEFAFGGKRMTLADASIKMRQEALWLILADFSQCTEDGYGDEVSLTERLRIVVTRGRDLAREVVELQESGMDPVTRAIHTMKRFSDTTPLEFSEEGVPHTNVDHGFYILYKEGYDLVAVHTPKGLFYGTPPEHTLAEHDYHPEQLISPQFGIVHTLNEEETAIGERLKARRSRD